jgi:hypothetical protein
MNRITGGFLMTLRVSPTKATGSWKGPLFSGVLALLLMGAPAAYAQFPPGTIEYTAKFVCGAVPSTGSSMVVPVGATFKTSINIHNPAAPTPPPMVSVTFLKKAVQSVPEPPAGTALPPPGTPVSDSLMPDYAEEVDCGIIKGKLLPSPAPPGFVEGWVVIYSLPTPGPTGPTPNPLDVQGVYTNSSGALYIKDAKEHTF